MARTAIQVHAINLIELGQEKSGSSFRTSRGCKLPTGSPITNKADFDWWVAKSRLFWTFGTSFGSRTLLDYCGKAYMIMRIQEKII